MYKDILLAIDLNDPSSWSRALPTAVDLCKMGDSNLHILTVVPDFGMSIVGQFFPDGYEKEIATKVLKQLKGFITEHVPAAISSRAIVGEGTVYEVILKIASRIDADLIVVASLRPELKDYLLGPNAARVVRHATCSVMVVREK